MPADTFFWDGTDTTTNADGGAGAWDAATTNWDTLATNGVDSAWPAVAGHTATLGGVSGTVSVNDPINVDKIIFDVTGYALSGAGPLTLTGAAPEISVTTAAHTATIGAVIAGTSFQKTGLGTLTLSGNNTHTGVTTVAAGTLVATHNGALGTFDGGTTVTSGAALTLQGGIAIGAEALSLAGTGVGTTGALRSISGVNSYAGDITRTANTEIQVDAGTLTLSGTQSGNFNTNYHIVAGATLVASGIISGTGNLATDNASFGTLILSEANTYSGATTIGRGTLIITNTTGSATGTGNVEVLGSASNTILVGGTGAIAGELTVRSNGNLAPGLPGSAGTLSTGGLILGSTTALNYDLGTVSDLVNVNGRLQWDGILNITAIDGFAAGTFRLVNFTGTLTNNTVTLGTVKMGFNYAFNTDIATLKQVNVTATATDTAFWDGVGAAGSNGVVGGGAGTWDTTNTKWTTSTGNANGKWVDGLTPIFQTTITASAVTISSPVSVGGIKFNTTGYTLTGSTITLGDTATNLAGIANNEVNVAGVAADTAIVASTFAGTNGLAKSGGGTLILNGNNTYSGGTNINAGTLQIGNGGTSGTLGAGAVSNATSLVFNRSDSITVSNAISGAGTLAQNGTGTLTLAGTNTYTGTTFVNSGTLVATSLAGGVTLASGATLAPTGTGIGTMSVGGALVWNGGGVLRFDADATTSDLITITGSLTKGTAGAFAFDFGGAALTSHQKYTLITATSLADFAAQDFSATNFTDATGGVFGIEGNSLVFTAVPEPSTYGLIGAGVLGLISALRRRQKHGA